MLMKTETLITLCYSLLSSTLTVVNKIILEEFPFPAFVLAVQLTSTAVIIYAGQLLSYVTVEPMSKQIIFGFLPLTFGFFCLIASSLLLMANSPFYLFLICKSLTPFFMSVAETVYFGTPYPTVQSFLAMVGMAIGSVFYTRYDADLRSRSLYYAVLFICCSVFEGLVAKQTIQKFDLNQSTRTLLMNALSCPIAITWTIVWETKAITEIDVKSTMFLGMSCALGLGMGVATMHMRTMFSATYVSVVGVCNKFLSLLFANVMLQGSSSRRSTISTAFVLLCGSFYNGNKTGSRGASLHTLRLTPLLIAVVFVILFLLNKEAYSTSLPSTMSAESATSGKVFLGVKTRNYKHPQTSATLSKIVKSRWESFGIDRCDHFAVVTTIFAPSEAVNDYCRQQREFQGCLLVIGDAKGPTNYTPSVSPCLHWFISYDEQQSFGGSFSHALPHNHFGRKNLGYVAAIQHGATSVWDFDDDNMLISDKMKDFLQSVAQDSISQVIRVTQPQFDVLNPYPALGSTHFAWPRGFPLTEIKSMKKTPKQWNTKPANTSLKNIGVVQAIANFDPDVDAIYRLQRQLPLNFVPKSDAIILPVPLGTMSPFNAQATLWATPTAFWGLYLPVSVHGRVSDIWRSYIFQRLAKEVCLQVAFSVSPWVEQRRNVHSYIADLDAEHDLYFKTGSLLDFLNTWVPPDSVSTISDMFIELYISLYEREYVHSADVKLSRMWIKELADIGYSFPALSNSCAAERSAERSEAIAISESSLSNTTFIVRINHHHGARAANKYLEVWSDTLQKYGVAHIVFYGGNLKVEDIQTPYGHLAVHVCENNYDPGGFFWYHLNCTDDGNNVRRLLSDMPTKGYFFAHDDAVLDLRSLSVMDTDVSWFTFGLSVSMQKYDITNATLVQNDGWSWIKSPWGARAILNALDDPEFSMKYNASLWQCTPDVGLTAGRAQSDVFFISSTQYAAFEKASALFAKHQIFLEIAVPTIANCVLHEFRSISLWTTWDQSRGNPPPPGTKSQVFHPIKLSVPSAYDFAVQYVIEL